MNTFEIGQKVVCHTPDKDGDLVKSQVYTIESFTYAGRGLNLKEVKPSTNNSGFRSDRFKAVLFEKALNNIENLL
jgi:hypothetical protein